MDIDDKLDGREREAAMWSLDGLGAGGIGQHLGVSTREAQRLVRRAFQRLGVTSRAELRELAGIDVEVEPDSSEGAAS